jgi:hypothetical protein
LKNGCQMFLACAGSNPWKTIVTVDVFVRVEGDALT